MNLIQKLFRRNGNGGSRIEEKIEESPYPIEKLRQHVDEEIEVHYINQDTFKIIRDPLRNMNDASFYMGSGCHRYIMQWNEKDFHGHLNAIKKIISKDGEILYENKELEFDYSNIHKKPEKSLLPNLIEDSFINKR
jgi:hypothetical protein